MVIDLDERARGLATCESGEACYGEWRQETRDEKLIRITHIVEVETVQCVEGRGSGIQPPLALLIDRFSGSSLGRRPVACDLHTGRIRRPGIIRICSSMALEYIRMLYDRYQGWAMGAAGSSKRSLFAASALRHTLSSCVQCALRQPAGAGQRVSTDRQSSP